MSRSRRIAIVAALLAPILLIVGAYVVRFAMQLSRGISDDPEQWGQFGDYVGGTLNPLYAFLAFCGVLVTLHLQSRQIALSQRLAEVDQLQQLMASTGTEINRVLSKELQVKSPRPPHTTQNLSVAMLLGSVSEASLRGAEELRPIVEEIGPLISMQVHELSVDLHNLVKVIEKFEEAGGSSLIAKCYQDRYAMHALSLQSIYPRLLHARTVEFFDLANLGEALYGAAWGEQVTGGVA